MGTSNISTSKFSQGVKRQNLIQSAALSAEPCLTKYLLFKPFCSDFQPIPLKEESSIRDSLITYKTYKTHSVQHIRRRSSSPLDDILPLNNANT